jgi:glycoprotein endo-alpha-1,2-mannosidase
MRRAAVIAAVGAALLGAATSIGAPTPTDSASPRVAIFYYAWYGTPAADGAWQHWDQGHNAPPQSIGSSYYPARGVYSSSAASAVRSQMREIASTGIDTVIVSWWGPGSVEDARLRPVAAAARAAGLRIALHVEPWPGRTPAAVVAALQGLRGLGIRDVYVYDSTRDPDDEWRAALSGLTGYRVFAHTPLPGKALRGGFQGLYTYDVLVNDGSSFARMCSSARSLALACAPSVGPGYDAYRATGDARVRDRNDGRWYDHMWQAAVRAAPDVVTITTYNEWHEGTQIEPARATGGPYLSYDGAWGLTGVRAQRAYLDRTAYWIRTLRGVQPMSRIGPRTTFRASRAQ